jgi:hypothetical protein
MEATVLGRVLLWVARLTVRVWLEERLPGLRFAARWIDRMQRQEETRRRRGLQRLRAAWPCG